MRALVMCFAALVTPLSSLAEACVAPHTLLRSVVKITTAERRGSGWFFKEKDLVVTNCHVLLEYSTKKRQEEFTIELTVGVAAPRAERAHLLHCGRLSYKGEINARDIAVILLKRKVAESAPLSVEAKKTEVSDGHVLAYPHGELHMAQPQFLRAYVENGAVIRGISRFSMYREIKGRRSEGFPFVGGSSGSPVVSCEGKVVGMIVAYHYYRGVLTNLVIDGGMLSAELSRVLSPYGITAR